MTGSTWSLHEPLAWLLEPISVPLTTTRSDLPLWPLAASACSTLMSVPPGPWTSAPSLDDEPSE